MVNNTKIKKYNGKKELVLILLEENQTYDEIQKQLKEKYGSGMSYRDLGKLRKELNDIIQPKTLEVYQNGFIRIYESLLSLRPLVKDPEIVEEIRLYHDLYHETRKNLIIKNLPEDLRNSKTIKSINESIDEIKKGNYIYFKEFKEKIEGLSGIAKT